MGLCLYDYDSSAIFRGAENELRAGMAAAPGCRWPAALNVPPGRHPLAEGLRDGLDECRFRISLVSRHVKQSNW